VTKACTDCSLENDTAIMGVSDPKERTPPVKSCDCRLVNTTALVITCIFLFIYLPESALEQLVHTVSQLWRTADSTMLERSPVLNERFRTFLKP
jgi:hypothetical protein